MAFWMRTLLAALVSVALLGCTASPDGDERGPAAGDTANSLAASDSLSLAAGFVGSATCAGCHEAEYLAWRDSHHDLAMQAASSETILGDFNDAVFEHNGVATRFFRRVDGFYVETDGPDGALTIYRVSHAFGVDPLQQYLIEFEAGRLQALGVAWDTRPLAEGGQRWFHLYGEENIAAGDPLHWTGIFQNWNTMCADCHSTNVQKGYDFDSHSYTTKFDSEDVACEACHGPGSTHVQNPLEAALRLEPAADAWVFAEGNSIASRADAPVAAEAGAQIETCAQCHSRRAQLGDHRPEARFLDTYRPEHLNRGLYHDDGQVRDEVYVYGSFVQSAMHGAGVVCTDCHDPHDLGLKADADAVCARCHLPEVFAVADHHRHLGDEPPQCVDCHMRAETFMGVDSRRDHSFRVPRPDLSVSSGTPNACGDCHADQSADWAATQISDWFPDGRWSDEHFATTFAAVRDWRVPAAATLIPIVEDVLVPAIVRATAIDLLAPAIESASSDLLIRLADAKDLQVPIALADAASEFLSAGRRVDLLQRFLSDSPDVLRLAAARALLPVRTLLSDRRRVELDSAITAALEAYRYGSDRPEGALLQAELLMAMGRADSAREVLEIVVERFEWYVPAYVNLADVHRFSGQDGLALEVIDAGLRADPTNPDAHLARGLTLVRLNRETDALDALESALRLAPQEPYVAFVYAVALNSLGDTERAIAVLEAASRRFPAYTDIWFALATISRDAGNRSAAIDYAIRLLEQAPTNAAGLALLAELRGP
jgi:tetratricopeptide (TPR) repeat protein